MRTKSKPKTPISPLRQRMIDDMIARKLGRESQRGHIAACLRFATWLKRSPDTATADEVRAFQTHLIDSGASICNRNRIMTGLKFLLKVTLRRHDLAAEIYHLKEPVRLPLVLAPDEVERIIAHAPSFQAHVMLVIAYGCGLRAGEVVRLRVCDIDGEQRIIRIVQSKGRKDRHVMLPADVHTLLREWWCERPVCNDMGIPSDERWIFPGRGDHEHLTTRQLSRLFHEAADAAGITKRVSLHSLRHSFATHMLEQGTDIRKIQAVLGHDKLDTTARYARVATGLIAKLVSPLEQLRIKRRRPKTRKSKDPSAK
jgi:site-specific recombinase XerD